MKNLTLNLDEPRELMYDELCEQFSQEEVDETLEDQLGKHLTQMYDNREQLEEHA